MSENQGITNEANLVRGSVDTLHIHDCTVNINAGGNVNNLVQPAVATTSQHSESHTQTRIGIIEKSVNADVQAKSKLKITGTFPTLREPTSQFSPQMTKLNNFFGDGVYEVNTDEFKSSMQATKGEPISCQQFLREITQGESKRIALIGGAGFGKTTELKKLAQTLLKNKNQKQDLPNQQYFKVLLWIDLKTLQDEETTLKELLFDDLDLSESDMEYLLDWIKCNQSNVIFLFDGLDQMQFKTGISHKKIRGLRKKRSAGCLIHNLLSRHIFPDVKIVTTSREHSVTMLPEEARPDLVIALTGFTQKDAEQIFREVSGEINDEAMKNIRELDMIKIPVYTIFAAVVHKYYNNNIPKYVSFLLAKILEVFTKSTQPREINVKNIKNLHKLMAMAFEGMKSRRMTFDVGDLKRHGLNKADVSDMMSTVPKQDIHLGLLMEGNILLMFCHQTLQEFLAACHISKMMSHDYNSFTQNHIKNYPKLFEDDVFQHWSVVVQYLAGITLNSEFELDECILKVSDKNKKQEILRDALRERIRRRDADNSAECLVLHESNDDSLIRQLERIEIRNNTPLNSNLARTISSLMRRNESMELITLQFCGITDNLLQIIGENMKSSHLRVKKVELWQHGWDVSFEALKSFVSNLEVDLLKMYPSPTDCREEFPIFQNVRTLKIDVEFIYGSMLGDVTITNERHRVLFEGFNFSGEFNKNEKFLKLHIKYGYLHDAVRAQNTWVADRVQVTTEGRCYAGLKDLHVMLDWKYEVDGQGMDLTVEVKLDDLELDTLVTGRSDIREASARWSVRSLNVMLQVESQEFLRKFKHEIGDYKIRHLTVRRSGSYVFCDDDFNITSSIVAQCRVEHLEFDLNENLKSENLKSILRNCKLKILECSSWTTFPTGEFNEIQETARLSGTELRGIEPSVSDHPFLPKFDFPRHFPTSSPDVHFPHHLAISPPVVPLPYHVRSSSAGVRLPYDSPTSSTNFRLPYHLPTSSTVVRHPYFSPTSLTDFRLSYNSPTSSPIVPIPYHLPTSSTGVRLLYDSPTLSTNVDLVSEDDYERDYSTEANDDDSNANDEIPSKKRRAV